MALSCVIPSTIAHSLQPSRQHCIADGLQTQEPESQHAKSLDKTRHHTQHKPKKCRIVVPVRHTPLILRVENPVVSPYDRDWYFGWAMPDELIDIWLTLFDGNWARDYSTTVRYERLAHHIKRETKCRTVRLVLTELTSHNPKTSEDITRPGEKAVAFYAVARNSLEKLPSEKHMERLEKFFGAEPWWAMDAREVHERETCYHGLRIPL
ncbi:uncharacterized protein SCHCODRAFT_02564795 [Schizophyllum commune H4-8]|uniref:uncharacterized protein n=1 Tax=Schizophyllum commune (strain H4-8 / FGSC 9210) TaxID=578458 RepID=UPI002161034E|nr:uncharacterized protein SCHCODRAFT_02564795 [Schizophyllum commune H4-8]KAI5897698.1 hypothetical protein SCHCODRAFT_02564795 [Schizophyllum commune H4-8]